MNLGGELLQASAKNLQTFAVRALTSDPGITDSSQRKMSNSKGHHLFGKSTSDVHFGMHSHGQG